MPSHKRLSLHYDEIFDHTVANAAMIWMQLEQAVSAGKSALPFACGDWNLDNGLDEHGKLVFWE